VRLPPPTRAFFGKPIVERPVRYSFIAKTNSASGLISAPLAPQADGQREEDKTAHLTTSSALPCGSSSGSALPLLQFRRPANWHRDVAIRCSPATPRALVQTYARIDLRGSGHISLSRTTAKIYAGPWPRVSRCALCLMLCGSRPSDAH